MRRTGVLLVINKMLMSDIELLLDTTFNYFLSITSTSSKFNGRIKYKGSKIPKTFLNFDKVVCPMFRQLFSKLDKIADYI